MPQVIVNPDEMRRFARNLEEIANFPLSVQIEEFYKLPSR